MCMFDHVCLSVLFVSVHVLTHPAYTIKQGHCYATTGVPCWHPAALSFSSGLFCFWSASGFFFAWAYVNAQFVSNEACNQTSHMGCLNACLLWQKPGTIKWEGPTPYMNHKKAQGGLRLDLRYEESIKWSSWTPWIHHKTGPLLWPLQVFPAGTLLLQVFPLVCFASEVPLASFCMGLCEFPVGFKWST